MEVIQIVLTAGSACIVGAAVTHLAGRAVAAARIRSISDERDAAQHEKAATDEAAVRLEAEKVTLTAERDKARHDLAAAETLHDAKLEAQSARLEEVRSEHIKVRSQRDRIRAERDEVRAELAAAKADHEARSQELTKAREQLDVQFKGMAADVIKASGEAFLKQAGEQFDGQRKAMKASGEAFLKQAGEQFDGQRKLNASELDKRQQAIAGIVKPVAENLDKFQKRVGELEEKREGAYKGLEKELTLLRDETTNLRGVTGNLSEAMRSSQVRGMWGEQQLRRILELSGMREHVDFHEQPVEHTHDGQLRPDAVVRVPGGVQVVIDAKTPLTSYLDACNAEDDKQQTELLGRHARSLMGHARALGDKKYTEAVVGSPDFTLMFVPADPILDSAMDVRPALWEEAWTKYRVLIATPGLLLAFLRTVALAWQQQALQQNAQEIAEQGMELYKRLRVYAGHVVDMGRSLGRAVDAYNKGVASMEARLLPQARKFEDLGPAAHLAEADKVATVAEIEAVPRATTAPELRSSFTRP